MFLISQCIEHSALVHNICSSVKNCLYSCLNRTLFFFQKRKLSRASWYCLGRFLEIKQTEFTSLKLKLLHIPNKKSNTFYEWYKALIYFMFNVYINLFKYHLACFLRMLHLTLLNSWIYLICYCTDQTHPHREQTQIKPRVCFLCPFRVYFDPKQTQGWHRADPEGT